MTRRFLMLASAMQLLLCVSAFAQETLRIDYYVWSRMETKWPIADTRPLKNLDILIYFLTEDVDSTGAVSYSPEALDHLTELKTVLRPETEIWVGVGDLTPLIKNPTKIANFITSVQQLATTHGFKGIDIDWEGSTALNDYTSVYHAVSQGLRKDGFRLSSSNGSTTNYVPKTAAIQNDVDWSNLQFYYSTLNSMSTAEMLSILQAYHNAGVGPEKLSIGLPLYGVQDAQNVDLGSPRDQSYAQLLDQGADSNANTFTNPDGATYHYSGIPLIHSKARVAWERGYRGVFTWEISLDTDYSSPLSILRAVDEEVLSNRDSDGDSMPDRWEVVHNLDAHNAADGVLDADGDGLRNAAEYHAGTNPQDASSTLLLSLSKPDTDSVKINWPGKLGRTYQIFRSDHLSNWQPLGVPLEGADQMFEVDVSATGNPQHFYKLSIESDPANLLRSPGFETLGPTSWNTKRATWGVKRNGDYGIAIQEPLGAVSYSGANQTLAVEPGQIVTMACHVNFPSWKPFSAGDQAYYVMHFTDQDGNQVGGYISDWWGGGSTPVNQWIKHTFSHAAPEGAANVRVEFMAYWDGIAGTLGGSEIYMDDASVSIRNLAP